jgi:hypothetical protein
VFDIYQESDRKGELVLWESHHGDNQKYKLIKDEIGLITFESKQSGKVITVKTESDVSGSLLIEEVNKGLPAQKFRIQERIPHSGEYFIYTFCGKVIDLS